MKEVILANCAALSYENLKSTRKGTQLTALSKEFSNNMYRVSDNFIYMNYEEDGKKIWGDYLLNDIEFIEQVSDDMNGFSATMFESKTYIVIAFRGTNDFMDVFSDAQLMLNRVTSQLGSAYKFTKEIVTIGNPFKKRIYLTGHSLGGALVQAMMCTDIAKKIELAMTFNGLGMKNTLNNWNAGKVSKTDIMASFGWSGVINPNTVADCLLDLYKSVKRRDNDSILGKTVSESEIKSILIKGTSTFVQRGGFTTVMKKEFDNFKIELGTIPSDKDVRLSPIIEKPITNTNLINNVEDRHIQIIKTVMDFILNVHITDDSLSKTKNYIISQDLVGCIREHIGNRIVVDDGDIPDIKYLIKNRTLLDVHSIGNFILFMNNHGLFDGKFRYSYILNILREFIKQDSKYAKILGDTNPTSITENMIDLILGAPISMLSNKVYMSKLTFEWVLKRILPYIILELVNDGDERFFRIGTLTNLDHKDAIGAIEPRIIKIIS